MVAFSCSQWARIASASSRSDASSSAIAVAARRRAGVGLGLEGLLLDLELHDAPLHGVQLGRHRVDLDAQAAGGLVDQVDGLVGQEARGDVAVRQPGGGDQRAVLDAHAVVHLVALLQAAQDRDGRLDRRLAHHHRLEAPLEGRVLLDVLAVLVERGRADARSSPRASIGLSRLAASTAPSAAPAPDDRVQLVDEEDDLALGVLRSPCSTALRRSSNSPRYLAPASSAPMSSATTRLPGQALGDVAGHDPLGQALDDRGLAGAGLADQHRVVLGAPRQHLDDAPDLLVAADHRVELARARRPR